MSLANEKEVNNFNECLARSHAASDLPFWKDVYLEAFPQMVDMHDMRQNGYWQPAGVDRRLILSPMGEVFVDEKVRGRNRISGIVYEDIALEFVSNTKTGAAGWVCKPLMANYIAYAIVPLGKCFLLPVIPLQEAWRRNGGEWRQKYKQRSARNNGYETLFCPVPESALMPAIGAWHRVAFEAIPDFTESAS